MRTLRLLSSCLVVLVLCVGCSSGAPSAPAPAEASSGAEAQPVDLTGEWMEYWALAGSADTQRYRFEPDGRFEWRTAISANDQPRERSGSYTVEGRELVLSIAREVIGGECATDCERVYVAPKQERLELAECPPNEEARALDASYRCESIGSHIFWLRTAQSK